MAVIRTVGVISDTHGLLRDSALHALRGADLIIHAGDVGPGDILARLREVAPVVAVRGNVDQGDWASGLPRTEVVQLPGANVYVLHSLAELDLVPAAGGFDIVISGHSHRPEIRERGGVLYLNPGSAGHRRFRLPVSLALLERSGDGWQARLVYLDPDAP
jgi:uncharacterized protein